MTEQKPSFRRQSITLAVAAAVFALSGTAWGADYNRITTTIEDSSVDASVTYTEVTSPVNAGTATPDLTFHYVPVQPEANSPITLTLNSLTVTNETTAGDVTVNTQVQDPAYPEDPTKLLDQTATYSKNGNGIATNTGAGITLELTEGLTVTTRDTAVSAADAATISGRLGGDLALTSSEGNAISATESTAGANTAQAVNFTLNGGTATIETQGDAIYASGFNSSVSLSGASDYVITSATGSALRSENGATISVRGTGSDTDGLVAHGSITLKSGGSAATVDVGPTADLNLPNYRPNTRTDIWADTVTIENTGTGSAIENHRSGDLLTVSATDKTGTGITLRNNSADNATIISGLPDEQKGLEDAHTAGIHIITYGAPLTIENQNASGNAILLKNRGSLLIQMDHGVPAQITGNITVDQGSNICLIVGSDGFIHTDKLTLTAGSMSDIATFGTSTWSDRAGTGKTQATADGVGALLSMQAWENSTINADAVLSGGAAGGFYAEDNGIRNGDTTLTGESGSGADRYPTQSYTYVNGNGQVNGNQYAYLGAKSTIYVQGSGSLTGNVVSDGVGTADGSPTETTFMAMDNGTVTGDLTASNGGKMMAGAMQSAVETGNVVATSGGQITYYLYGMDTRIPTLNGDLVSEDSGSITASMNGIWNGASTVSGGTTDVTFMDANAVWNVTRDSELTNFTQGAGTVNYPTADAKSFTGTTITVDGNYSADGGSLNMSTVLTGDTSPHDKLVVKGDTSGTASITFTRVTGWGAQTIEGIKVVEVDGTSDAVFTKPDSNRLTAGAYVYDLKKVGNDWYLTSQRDPNAPTIILPKTNDDPAPTPDPDNGDDLPDVLPSVDPGDITAHNVKPELGSYAANMLASNTLFTMSLNDRLGETRYSDALKSQKHSGNVWIRMAGGKSHTEMADDQLTNRGDWGLVQVGGDVVSWAGSGDHRFHVGLMMGYAHQNEKTRSSAIGSTSKGKVSGYSAGLYATYMNAAPAATGPYVDTWLLWQKFKNKVDPSNSVEESYDSKGFTGSIEAGYTFGLKDWVSADGTKNAARLQLQAQVIRMGVRADQHIDAENFTVAGTGAGNIRTRVGATVYHLFTNEKTGRAVKPFIGLNWYHDTKTFGVTYDGIHDRIQGNRNFGELKLGVEGKLSKHVNLWGAAAYQQGSHSFRNLGAFIGAKVLF